MNTEEQHIIMSEWSRKGYLVVNDDGHVWAVKDGKATLLFVREEKKEVA